MSGTSMAMAMLIANPVILGSGPPPLAQTTEAPEAAQVDMVQGDADAHLRMTVQVAVHGLGPYRFLIDTGSQRTVISTALASTLGLTPGPTVRIVGIAGARDTATAQIESLTVGPRSLYDLTVPLLERTNMGADGIVGTDSLQHQRILLDFSRNTIAIGDASQTGGTRGFEIVVKAKQRSGRLILTNALIDGVRTDVVIDTGASGSIGNRALQRALTAKRRVAMFKSSVSSVTGQELPVDLVVADKLELGGIGIANIVIAYADAPAFAELKLDRKPAVFLGMRELRAFKRVAIDFTKRKVSFDLIEAR
ncbi:retroviral-like aspartic protease family protein [Novosphingobium guangzhouense]|uniref:Peptidase A2 n=1 Tax=Novosphingobium guangzhouense TaxID=1850347 RepID=A0A2K2FV98_9SPHN|nr:retroviral-like aspartic protease family protein [Novosphingobium guangzhouense]PNU02711.1 peptidase A2 [Novosphingobium guangzhouense]